MELKDEMTTSIDRAEPTRTNQTTEVVNDLVFSPAEPPVEPPVAQPVTSLVVQPTDRSLALTTEQAVERPLPDGLRYLMLGLLVVGVVGVVAFGYMHQTSIKSTPATTTSATGDCKDPLLENRLRETLKQSPNDYETLREWGNYNLDCAKNFQIAVAAFNQIVTLAQQPNTKINDMQRTEARLRLGLAYLYGGNNEKSREQFEEIIKTDPSNPSVLLVLGVSYEKDDPTKAISYFNQVLQLDPGGDFGKQAQSMLNYLGQPTPTPKK